MFAKFSDDESKRTVCKLQKERLCVGYSIKWASEIRKFHVAVLQRRLRIVQKRVMHVQTCCFANMNLLLFCRALCRPCCRCLSPPLLWSRSFATMVTWRHTTPLKLRPFLTQHSWLNLTLFLQLACGLNHGILEKKKKSSGDCRIRRHCNRFGTILNCKIKKQKRKKREETEESTKKTRN